MEPGETSDSFVVSGRGTLHLGILIENMRREGYEFEIGPPKVRPPLIFLRGRGVTGHGVRRIEPGLHEVPAFGGLG